MLRPRKQCQRGLERLHDLGQTRNDVDGLGVVGHGVQVEDGGEASEVLGVNRENIGGKGAADLGFNDRIWW